MAADSQSSTESGKRSTKKTSGLTLDQALQIVQQSLLEYQKAGGKVEIIENLWHGGECYTAIALPGVHLIDGNFAINGK